MTKNYLIICLLCSFLGFSQFNPAAPWMDEINASKKGEVTIDELVVAFNQYWLTHDKNVKGSGYKPFMRSEFHWRSFTNEQGFIQSSEEFWNAWKQKKQSKITSRNAVLSLPVSNWQPVGPFTHTNTGSWSSGQGRVNIVHVDPSNSNTIYLGAPAGGIWKSTDNGSTWTPLTDELPQIGVSGIAVDYSDSNTIYIATGDKDAGDSYSVGVYKSTDGGATWNPTGIMGTTSNPSRAGDILIHPTNNQILWCATNSGIYRTTNAGATWSRVRLGDFSQGSIRLKPGSPDIVYAVSDNAFYRSTNTGSSFSQITSGLPTASSRLLLDVTPANVDYVYVLSAASGGEFQGIYRSTDGGTTFTARNTTTDVFESNQSWYDLALAVSSTNAEEIYTGCLNVWKSVSGGTSITKINSWSNPSGPSYTHADIHYLGFHGTRLFAGTDGGIYVSDNNGSNFTDLTAGVQISQFYRIAVSKQSSANMVGGLQDNGGHAYSGGIWKNYYGADGMDTAINPNNQNQYYGFIQNGSTLYISDSAGNGITGSVSSPGVSGNWVTPLIANNSGELFSGFDGLYKLNGTSWTLQNADPLGSGNVDIIEVDPSNDDIMYVANGFALYKSTNRGVNFTNVYNLPSGNIQSVEVHSTDSNIVYLVSSGSSGAVLKSTDGGINFTDISNGLPSIGKNCIVHQGRNTDNPLYLGTTLGVYYRDDSMAQWEPFDTNLPNVSVRDLEINLEDAKLIAATYGRGVWETPIPVQLANVDVKFIAIQNPGININCNDNVVPQIQVKNNGLTTLNTISVDYTIDATPYTYNWSGTILSNEVTSIDLPAVTLSRGMHSMNVTTTTTNDAFSDNNQGSATFYVNDSGTIGLTNTFTNTTDQLISYKEGATGAQWVRTVRTDGLSSSSNIVYSTNTNGNYPNNTKAYLVSQCYNLSNVINPQISFSMKYELEENWDVAYVEYSTNFGASWSVLGTMGATWYNSDRTSATTGNDCYNCPGAQWTGSNVNLTTYSYPLNALNSETNIIFRIVFHSDSSVVGLGVNIDDFLIDGTLSNENFEIQNIVLYPNPSEGNFYINWGDVKPNAIEVYDLTGKIVWSNYNVSNSSSEINLNLSSVQQGVYFVKISTENSSVVKRVIKK